MIDHPLNGQPYLEYLGNQAGFDLWEVSGEWLRAHEDMDWTNFGQHYRFPFIPADEFWFDVEARPDDFPFFLDHLLIEHRLMDGGMDYDRALVIADRKERSERQRASGMTPVTYDEFATNDTPHINLLAGCKDAVIWLVSGSYVRGHLFEDFTEGGHWLVYPFIPQGEIWIDDDITADEYAFVIVHEVLEHYLMEGGMKYNEAHSKTNEVELTLRRTGGPETYRILEELGVVWNMEAPEGETNE